MVSGCCDPVQAADTISPVHGMASPLSAACVRKLQPQFRTECRSRACCSPWPPVHAVWLMSAASGSHIATTRTQRSDRPAATMVQPPAPFFLYRLCLPTACQHETESPRSIPAADGTLWQVQIHVRLQPLQRGLHVPPALLHRLAHLLGQKLGQLVGLPGPPAGTCLIRSC